MIETIIITILSILWIIPVIVAMIILAPFILIELIIEYINKGE